MSNLEDFFARKDRKKNKKPCKYLTSEEMLKNLEEEADKNLQRAKKESSMLMGSESDDPGLEDEKWKEFDEEKKNYTGLKIGYLTLKDEDNVLLNTAGNDDQLFDAESYENGVNRHAGPWNKIPIVAAAPTCKENQPKQSDNSNSKGYVPPHLRKKAQQLVRPSRFNSSSAPDINNEIYFPTLSEVGEQIAIEGYKHEHEFKEVRHGGRLVTHLPVQELKPLEVGNRYKSLNDEN